MSPKLHNKLSALADRCESLAAEIRAALSEADDSNRSAPKRPRTTTDADTDATIQQLKQGSREQAATALADLPQTTLAQIYRSLGGGSRDAKKPKDFVVGRILWRLFDFSEGHDILKQPATGNAQR